MVTKLDFMASLQARNLTAKSNAEIPFKPAESKNLNFRNNLEQALRSSRDASKRENKSDGQNGFRRAEDSNQAYRAKERSLQGENKAVKENQSKFTPDKDSWETGKTADSKTKELSKDTQITEEKKLTKSEELLSDAEATEKKTSVNEMMSGIMQLMSMLQEGKPISVEELEVLHQYSKNAESMLFSSAKYDQDLVALSESLKQLINQLELNAEKLSAHGNQEFMLNMKNALDALRSAVAEGAEVNSESKSQRSPSLDFDVKVMEAKEVIQTVVRPINLKESTSKDQDYDLEAVQKDSKTTGTDEVNVEEVKNYGIQTAAIAENKVEGVLNQSTEAENTLNDVAYIKSTNIRTENDAAASKTAPTPKPMVENKEVINQIVKKAEVFINDGQSEMNLRLEPDSLGKLTLKIAVEKGLVTASFVAENQQVKEIIESNFNQLKNALQEKGITVQGFSVSVGQDNKNQNSEDRGMGTFKKQNSIKLASSKNVNYIELDGNAARVKNPYDYHEGKVDFKA